MIQEIAPHCYDNTFCARPAAADDPLLAVSQQGLWLRQTAQGEPAFPQCGEVGCDLSGLQRLFAVDGRHYYLAPQGFTPAGCTDTPQGELRTLAPQWLAFTAVTGLQLSRWYDRHRLCGRCGAALAAGAAERSLVCPECGLTLYPQIAPAVIVAVTRGDQLLLTRYADRPYRRWALVAGFNEIGESIEDTVRREVREETGLTVTDLRFYRSQPWSFTDCLLLGFFCRAVGDAEPHADGQELAEARWFQRREVPVDDNRISLTREMMALFRDGAGGAGP